MPGAGADARRTSGGGGGPRPKITWRASACAKKAAGARTVALKDTVIIGTSIKFESITECVKRTKSKNVVVYTIRRISYDSELVVPTLNSN